VLCGPGRVTVILQVGVFCCLRFERFGWVGVLAMSLRSCEELEGEFEVEFEEEELEEELSLL
jgi:hypothetical protein